MMTTTTADSPPKLLKSRMRHTRILIFFLLPIVIFAAPALSPDDALREAMKWLGYFLIILCVLGRSFSSAYIGGKKNDELIHEGPFSIVRNPLYVFSFLGVAGIAMEFGSLLVTAVSMASFALYYPHVVKREEALLQQKFGEAYAEYSRKVPRWIPKFSLWHSPAIIEMKPTFLLYTMRDASGFFLPFPILEMLARWHAEGVIATLLLLP